MCYTRLCNHLVESTVICCFAGGQSHGEFLAHSHLKRCFFNGKCQNTQWEKQHASKCFVTDFSHFWHLSSIRIYLVGTLQTSLESTLLLDAMNSYFQNESRCWQLKHFLNVHPENWGKVSNLTSIFCWNGLVQPPPRNGFLCGLLFSLFFLGVKWHPWEWTSVKCPLVPYRPTRFGEFLTSRLIWVVEPKNRGKKPQNGWFIVENPIKGDDLGGNTIFGNHTYEPNSSFHIAS